MKTTNQYLQTQLDAWLVTLDDINPSNRSELLTQFVRSFVPFENITEDDILGFAGQLIDDLEFYQSFYRDIRCCCTGIQYYIIINIFTMITIIIFYQGELVEKIEGNQKARAVFTILPSPGTLTENSTLDIVREVVFVSLDNGVTWRAEG